MKQLNIKLLIGLVVPVLVLVIWEYQRKPIVVKEESTLQVVSEEDMRKEVLFSFDSRTSDPQWVKFTDEWLKSGKREIRLPNGYAITYGKLSPAANCPGLPVNGKRNEG